MDLHKMIAELQEEKHRLDEAIEALERLSGGGQKRRGRPPKWMKPAPAATGQERAPVANPINAKKQP